MRDEILKELSIDNVMKHTRYLADDLPERFSGNANEQKAAAYLEQALKTAGVPVTLHEFTGYTSLPVHSRLTILSPGRERDPFGPLHEHPQHSASGD